jgi:hypothetical protein
VQQLVERRRRGHVRSPIEATPYKPARGRPRVFKDKIVRLRKDLSKRGVTIFTKAFHRCGIPASVLTDIHW